MRISQNPITITTPVLKQSQPTVAPVVAGDVAEISQAPAKPGKPDDQAPKAEPESFLKKAFQGKGPVIAGAVAAGVGAAAMGVMGGAAGAVAGAVGGLALGATAAVAVIGAGFVAIAEKEPIIALGLLIAGGAVAAFLSPFIIGAGVAGMVGLGAVGSAGGPIAGALAGVGGALVGGAVVSSAQKAFQ